jgi:hypothetical protein
MNFGFTIDGIKYTNLFNHKMLSNALLLNLRS